MVTVHHETAGYGDRKQPLPLGSDGPGYRLQARAANYLGERHVLTDADLKERPDIRDGLLGRDYRSPYDGGMAGMGHWGWIIQIDDPPALGDRYGRRYRFRDGTDWPRYAETYERTVCEQACWCYWDLFPRIVPDSAWQSCSLIQRHLIECIEVLLGPDDCGASREELVSLLSPAAPADVYAVLDVLVRVGVLVATPRRLGPTWYQSVRRLDYGDLRRVPPGAAHECGRSDEPGYDDAAWLFHVLYHRYSGHM